MSIDAAALADSLRRLATSEQGHDTVVSALEQVLAACVDLFTVDGAGILVADEQDMLRYVAASKLDYVRTQPVMDPISEAFAEWVRSDACEASLR